MGLPDRIKGAAAAAFAAIQLASAPVYAAEPIAKDRPTLLAMLKDERFLAKATKAEARALLPPDFYPGKGVSEDGRFSLFIKRVCDKIEFDNTYSLSEKENCESGSPLCNDYDYGRKKVVLKALSKESREVLRKVLPFLKGGYLKLEMRDNAPFTQRLNESEESLEGILEDGSLRNGSRLKIGARFVIEDNEVSQELKASYVGRGMDLFAKYDLSSSDAGIGAEYALSKNFFVTGEYSGKGIDDAGIKKDERRLLLGLRGRF